MNGNRRLHARVPLAGAPARLRVDDGSRHKVDLVDMSEGGICWAATTPVPDGARVSLTLRTGRVLAQTMTVTAVVVRADDTAQVTAARLVTVSNSARLERYLRTARTRRGLVHTAPADADAMAALRVLAMSLDRASGRESRVVAIASARHGEGKSFVAAGVASSLAALGRPVLLVDADLQRPTQHIRFLNGEAAGLAELTLAPTAQRARELVQGTASGVAVLPWGLASPGATIGVDGVALLMSALRSLGFPLVVVDVSPVLTSAESVLFCRAADETILTVRSGTTRERDARDALSLLRRHGVASPAVILNDYDDAFSGSRGGTPLTPTMPAGRAPLGERLDAQGVESGPLTAVRLQGW